MYKPVEAIEVRIWGQKVGAVALDPNLRFYVFEYEPNFVKTGIELAPLTMPLAKASEPFVFTDLPEQTYKRLPALLADALPDDFGNTLINGWMAAQGVERDAVTALDRLAYMGVRSMGALEFKPAIGPEAKDSTAIALADLVEGARRAVRGDLGSDASARAVLSQIVSVGTSAGGARAKAVVAWNPKTEEIRAGQFDAEDGFEHWLLKFDGMGEDRELGGSQDYGRIEYAYYKMATAAGIRMSPCRLLEENERAHFMTRRFDRDGNRKHHMQTLCAMAHLDYKQKASHDYNQLFQTIDQLRLGYEAKEEAFRRMAFNVMAANCDDHTKNFSFLLRENEGWTLAPAYDVTHAHNPKGEWTSQHLMSVNGRFADITRQDLLAVADRFGIGTAAKVLKQIGDVLMAWPDFAASANVSPKERDRISSHHRIL
ncbi:MAG: type II toxin-antitoxin system HipA family toxin [Kiritimatiellae bacterium]|nr:type II toxin-antitoxin system HipA family toxin [Kiritimatiellia bacterium]MDD2346766.1 type II toxin-antitoxin system HipA family toxin [Kiritimatiellia bacterium]MDD3583036.1 type II toxin-antitoxin system HipA family toxin [Kiritimatiellia bacterium]HHU16002.1 type II toxin-antitoxin system HipA family toxin [Lentisphaerota bacterium]HON46905.1 type II toxin-antitoxin system HipA family toxin [Kiritimatiellia bacterium]